MRISFAGNKLCRVLDKDLPCGSCVSICGIIEEVFGHGKELAPLAPNARAERDATKELGIGHVVVAICQSLAE